MMAVTISELPNRERRTSVRSHDFPPTYRLQPVVVQFDFWPGQWCMASSKHEIYARGLLAALSPDHDRRNEIAFAPKTRQSRNAAHAMTAILCRRLSANSGHEPKRRANNDYVWKDGEINNRNIADRDHFWTNVRRSVADRIHTTAGTRPSAFLLACNSPNENGMLQVWAIPEPIIYDALALLPEKESARSRGESEYTIEIWPSRQRIERCEAARLDAVSLFAPVVRGGIAAP